MKFKIEKYQYISRNWFYIIWLVIAIVILLLFNFLYWWFNMQDKVFVEVILAFDIPYFSILILPFIVSLIQYNLFYFGLKGRYEDISEKQRVFSKKILNKGDIFENLRKTWRYIDNHNAKNKPLPIYGNFGSGKSTYISILSGVTQKFYSGNIKITKKKNISSISLTDKDGNFKKKGSYTVHRFETLSYDDYSDPFGAFISFLTKTEILSKKSIKKINLIITNMNVGFANKLLKNSVYVSGLISFQREIIKILQNDEKLKTQEHKTVIVIDELDRTDPFFAYKMLEIVSLYLRKTKMVFLITLSDKPFRKMLSNKYGEQDKNRYLSKFVKSENVVRIEPVTLKEYLLNMGLLDTENNEEKANIKNTIEKALSYIGIKSKDFSYRTYEAINETLINNKWIFKNTFLGWRAVFSMIVTQIGNQHTREDLRQALIDNKDLLKDEFANLKISSKTRVFKTYNNNDVINMLIEYPNTKSFYSGTWDIESDRAFKIIEESNKINEFFEMNDKHINEISKLKIELEYVIKKYNDISIVEKAKRLILKLNENLDLDLKNINIIKTKIRDMQKNYKRHYRIIERRINEYQA